MPPQVSPADFAKTLGGTVASGAPPVDPSTFAKQLGGQPQSLEDKIRSLATENGLDPELAVAVARRESRDPKTGQINYKAVGDGGKAIGTFQLHEGAGKDTGVKRDDPIDNLLGGVRYLKQLSDRYKGDKIKILTAYNGGMGNVDKGTISPEAQAYAAEVIADLSRGVRTAQTGAGRAGGPGQTGRGGGAGPGPAPGTITTTPDLPTPLSIAKAVAKPFDPRTPEGRVNLASEAASLGVSLIPGGRVVTPVIGRTMPQVAPWIARVLGPPIAAAIAGGAERSIEQSMGMSQGEESGLMTGVKQFGYEVAGQALMWPVRRFVVRPILGAKVSREAGSALKEEAHMTAERGREAVSATRQRAREHTEAARMYAQADAAAERARQAPIVQAATEAATAQKVAISEQTAAQIAAARAAAKAQVAQVELDGTAALQDISRQYQTLLGAPPSTAGTAEAVRAVVNPGVRGLPKGPAQIALDEAGKRVEKASQTGPAVRLAPLQQALESMRAGAYPDGLVGSDAAKALPVVTGGKMTPAEFSAALAEAKGDLARIATGGGAEAHPLPKVLGLIQSAPSDAISFSDAHKLKGLLDEAVSWDRSAKRKLERITKGIRVALRTTMAGNEAYDQATAAYAELIPLYRKGIGKQIITAAQDNPDALMGLFDPKKPLQAKAARDLLITQATEGGDPAAGKAAWDSVRAAFTYRNVINGPGGVEKLAERVHTLVTQYPEFAKTVYHDETGQQVLSNLAELGKAYVQGQARLAAEVGAAKAAGTELVEKTIGQAEAGKAVASTKVDLRLTSARDAAAQAIRDAKAAGAKTTRAVAASGDEAVREAQHAAQTAKKDVREATRRFAESSVGSPRKLADQVGDIAQVTVGSTPAWISRSVIRLMTGPKANDILEWAAFSSQNTQRLSSALLGQLPDRAAATLFRDMQAADVLTGTTTKAPPQERAR